LLKTILPSLLAAMPEIPEKSRTARGQGLYEFFATDERVVKMIVVPENAKDEFLALISKKGVLKKVKANAFVKIHKGGLKAMKLKPGDELFDVFLGQSDYIGFIVSKNGQAIKFKLDEIRAMGRGAAGVRGIRLKVNDEVADFLCVNKNELDEIIILMEKGYGKRVKFSQFSLQHRGGGGVKAAKIIKKYFWLAMAAQPVSQSTLQPSLWEDSSLKGKDCLQ